MLAVKRLILLPVAFLLAGCAQENLDGVVPKATDDTPGTDSVPASSTNPSNVSVPLQMPNHQLSGSNCTGVSTRYSSTYAAHPATLPEPWQSDLTQGITFINSWTSRCQRVGWGPIERPATVIFEGHQSYNLPPSCRSETGSPSGYVLATFLSNDTSLTAYAKTFGWSAHDATIDQQESSASVDLSWTVDGGATSKLSIPKPPRAVDNVRGPESIRFFWFNDTSVSYWEMKFQQEFDQFAPPVTAGEVHPPMFFAESGQRAYAGIAEVNFALDFSGEIHRFRDLLCEDPI